MRIVYINPPPPPSFARYLSEMAVYVAAGYVLALILIQVGTVNVLLKPLYDIVAPLVKLPLQLSGVLRVSQPAYNGLLVVFMMFLLRALLVLPRMVRWVSYSIIELDQAIGYIKRPVHKPWFWGALSLLLVATLVNLWPPLVVADTMTQVIIDCTRILGVVGGVAGASATVMIGMDLRQSWIKGGSQNKPVPVGAKPRGKPALTLVQPEPVVEAKAPISPIYLALAAELVQSCGRSGAVPTAEDMVKALSTLQHVARLTGNQSVTDQELVGLCQRLLAVFSARQLKTLPDLAAAKKLYGRKGPGVLSPLAEELASKLTMN